MHRQVSVWLIIAAPFLAMTTGIMFGLQDPKARIRAAASIFLGPADPSIAKSKIAGALVELLDVAVSMTHESQFNTEIKYRVDAAKELFQKESIFDDKARQCLSFVFRMLTDGKKYERPKELEEFVTPAEAQEKAREYANELVDKALANLKEGNELKTAKLLLELVLMIVAPIPG